MVFANLNNSKTCFLSCDFRIWYKDHVVLISYYLEQVGRTNLFKFPKGAVKKIKVFHALMNSILSPLMGVFLIWYNKAMETIWGHLE